MATNLYVYDPAGNRIGSLPWSTLTRSRVRNAAGAVTATVPRSLLRPSLLDGEPYLRISVDGVELPEWFLVDDDGDDDADAGGQARAVTIAGSGVLAVLDWAVVYPYHHAPGVPLPNLDPTFGVASQTPGWIMGQLIDRAQARGCFPQLSCSFSATHDSAGRPWPTTYSRVYEIGQTLGKVLTQMTDDGWVDARMTRMTLDLFVPDTVLGVDHPDVVLKLGKGVVAAPRKRTRKPIRSVLLANGAEGAILERADATATGRYGRREGYEGRSGVTDYGTLTAVTEVSLGRQTDASESVTLELDPQVVDGLPEVGCFIRYDQRRRSATELEPLRIQSVAESYGEDPKLSIELNDLWVDHDVRMARRIDAIMNGSSANERVPPPPADTDEVPPGPVLGLAVASAPYTDDQGVTAAQVTASWAQVTADADGSVVDELAGYRIQWRLPEYTTRLVQPGLGDAGGTEQVGVFERTFEVHAITRTTWSPVPADTSIEVRIQAFDRWGNAGVWSQWVVTRTGKDGTPPPPPSPPVVDNYLGLLRVEWAGGAAGGQPMPPDLAHVEVHVAAVANFAAGEATLVGSMTVAGPVFTESAYGQTRYAKLVAVDTSGNRSQPSAEVTGVSQPVVAADIFDGAVGSAKLADLAVTTAKINDLAVNSAKIGSLDAGKITTGVLSAQVTLSGRIATAMSGTRVELNAAGIYAWRGTTQTVAIDADGALLTGTYMTARSGRRIEIGLENSSTAQIDLWGPFGGMGGRSFLRSYTAHTGYEALQVGVGDPTVVSGGGYGEARVSMVNTGVNANGVVTGDYDARFTNHTINYGGNVDFVDFAGGSGTAGDVRLRLRAADNSALFVLEKFTVRSNIYPTVELVYNQFGDFVINYGANAGGRWSVTGGVAAHASPQIRMIASNGAGNLLQTVDDNGVFTELRNGNNTAFTSFRAASYNVISDAGGKREITAHDRSVDGSLLERVRAAPVRRYRRLRGSRAAGPGEVGPGEVGPGEQEAGEVGPVEFGLVAQEAPGDIVHTGRDGSSIDLYQMATLLWGAAQETADDLDELRDELRTQLAALRDDLMTLREGG